MERLTERFSNGQAASYWCGSNCKYDHKYCRENLENCPAMEDILEKLAHYEDLEESGRLVVLPEVFDEKKLFRVLSYSACPNEFNLPRSEKCPVIPCKDCWENALKIKG